MTPAEWKPCSPATPRCEFWTWGKDYIRPGCCTQHLRDLISFIGDLLRQHGIFYFLDYGSLLGAVRSGHLIDWDEDADFSCLAEDLDRILALRSEVEAAGFWLDTREAPHVVRICRSRTNLIHADIWFQRIKGGFAYTWSRLHEHRYRFPVSYLRNPGSVVLEERSYPAPAPVDRFLAEHRYGPDFMSPRRVSANYGWVSGDLLSDEVRCALETLRDVDYRIDSLEAQRKRAGNPSSSASGVAGWLAGLMTKAPSSAHRLHRSTWKLKQRLSGVNNPVLLDVRYDLMRREALLRLLDPKPSEDLR